MGEPLSVGMVGVGISGQYLATIERTSSLRLAAVADLDPARAADVAAARPAVRPLEVDVLLVDPTLIWCSTSPFLLRTRMWRCGCGVGRLR